MKLLSIGIPSTLGNWYQLSCVTFGTDSKPTKFIENKMNEQGADMEVIADERQLLMLLGQMLIEEQDENINSL